MKKAEVALATSVGGQKCFADPSLLSPV